jgi:hypothetical protein
MLATDTKLTIKHLWKDLISVLKIVTIDESDLAITGQVRLAG